MWKCYFIRCGYKSYFHLLRTKAEGGAGRWSTVSCWFSNPPLLSPSRFLVLLGPSLLQFPKWWLVEFICEVIMVNILLNKIKQDPVMTVNIQLNPKGLKRNRRAPGWNIACHSCNKLYITAFFNEERFSRQLTI